MGFIFIILRHVNSEITNLYWQESYKSIRKHYPATPIYIIDDYSKPEFLTQIPESYHNVQVINSELEPGRGEILPYYYYHKYHSQLFGQASHAIVLHDSVFVNSSTIFTEESMPATVQPLWAITHHIYDNRELEHTLLNNLTNHDSLISLYENKKVWPIFFGVMSVISYSFLDKLQQTYNILELVKYISTRDNRMALERVFGLCCQSLCDNKLIGRIARNGINQAWGTSFQAYIDNKIKNQQHLPCIKVWSGR